MKWHLPINLALGGSWGGKIDDAALPQKYLIDYVRIYRARDRDDKARKNSRTKSGVTK